jgi:DNA replication licensing factor MCM5
MPVLIVPPTRDALRTNILIKQYKLEVDIAHLISFNEELAHKLANEPTEILPIVYSAQHSM